MALLITSDAVVAAASLGLALLLRFDGKAPPQFGTRMALFAPIAAGLLILLSVLRGLYASVPKYASLREMLRLAGVVASTVVGLMAASMIYYLLEDRRPLPLSVPLIWGPILFLGLGTSRMSGRVRAHLRAGRLAHSQADRVLIVGAGDAGEHVARDMLRHGSHKLAPVGFVDDDPNKIGRRIHGLPVLGPIHELAAAVARTRPDYVLIALPSAPSRVIQLILRLVAEAGARAKILPGLAELMGAPVTSAQIRDVDVSDLIGRRRVEIDVRQVARIFDGKTVLITGAAGSIGSELANQALRFKPARLLLLDNNETDLFLLADRLSAAADSRGTDLQMVIADIRDRGRFDRIFREHRPALVLHAAAYKHVPVMELHPGEAVLTNVTGTKNVAEAACRYEAERFILVSTDKAVSPTSVMGATKRVAEMALSVIGARGCRTTLAAVRFGNVFASRGSVVPLFLEQIRQGGPITVTHREATRYFMTIDEAAALICQAGAIAKGAETFVLDMGEPVRILELAERMRDLFSSPGQEAEIVVTGLRPGEKLNEDLWHDKEKLAGKVRSGILKAKPASQDLDRERIDAAINLLEQLVAEDRTPEEIRTALFAIVDMERNSPLSTVP